MSVFYDEASLVLVPSGYKAEKVYAQKPLTTDGQLTFSRASTATRVNASGLIEAVSSNVPRLDYLNSTCPKLLLEPQRSNGVLYSEQFDNAAYSPVNITVIANDTIAPSGTTSADKVIPTTTNTFHLINSNNVTSSGNYTFSLFVKAAGLSKVALRESATVGFFASFDLTNQTILDSSSSQTNTITSVGNGWYRITSTRNYAGTINLGIVPLPNSYTSGDPLAFYAGDGTSGIFVWGAQIETGTYATSYIPTTAATVTRLADACSKTGISSLIGGTSGTIFFEVKTNKTLTSTNYKQFFYYTDASGAQAYMYLDGSNTLVLNPSLGNISSSINLAADTTYKIALAYATNDFKLYINGVERGTSASGTSISAVNLLSLGSYQGSSEFNEFTFAQYLHFKTRLTNAQLAEITQL
jgi:hypothetical protein